MRFEKLTGFPENSAEEAREKLLIEGDRLTSTSSGKSYTFGRLEMISPEVTPEAGVDQYEYDHTKGPACTIAAGAGTFSGITSYQLMGN